MHLRAEYERYDWKAHAAWNDGRLLRSVRADEGQPQRLLRRASATATRWSSTNRSALTLEIEGRVAGKLDQLPRVPERRRSAWIGWSSLTAQLSSTATSAARSAAWTTRRGRSGRLICTSATTSTRRCSRSVHGTYDIGTRAAARALVDLAAQRGRLLAAATPTSRLRTSSSAASATTTSITARRSGTAKYYSFPGAEINEIGGTQLRPVDARMERCRRCGSAASARPARISAGCGRRCSSAGSSPISTTPPSGAGGVGRRADRSAVQRAVGARHDVFGGRRRSRSGDGVPPRGESPWCRCECCGRPA